MNNKYKSIWKGYVKYPDGEKVELCEHSVPSKFHCYECVIKSIRLLDIPDEVIKP